MAVAPGLAALRWVTFTVVLLGLVAPAPEASAVAPGWTRQFGTTNVDEALAVTIDRSGNSYVAGWTQGVLPGQTSAGNLDAFVRKYDRAGTELWTRQFGSSDRDYLRGVVADADGNVYLAGETEGTLPGQVPAGGRDAFLRKYDPAGTELWTRQFGGGGGDGGAGVALDAAGDAYIVGTTRGAMPGQTPGGDYDAFVRRYDPAGNEIWTRQFGGIEGEGARSVAVGPGGKLLIVGSTQGAFPEQSNSGGFDAFITQYDIDGNALWMRQFGSAVNDFGVAVATDENGEVIVVGSTDGILLTKSTGGGTDAFVRRYDAAGTAMWTEQFGGKFTDSAMGVAMDPTGRVFVAGTTERSGPGQPGRGQDAFIHCYDSIGRQQWASEFGTEATDMALGVALDGHVIHLVGSTLGSLQGQTSTGSRDAFVLTLG
ncbi:MAG: SBBP repeat-containing protein [Actinomycetota bacterium]|nr:SBBP repeat-containing protein [Actinomycetota bacterium]